MNGFLVGVATGIIVGGGATIAAIGTYLSKQKKESNENQKVKLDFKTDECEIIDINTLTEWFKSCNCKGDCTKGAIFTKGVLLSEIPLLGEIELPEGEFLFQCFFKSNNEVSTGRFVKYLAMDEALKSTLENNSGKLIITNLNG